MGQLVTTPSYDGYIDRQYESTWSAARDASEGDVIDETSSSIYLRSETGYHCSRFFLIFDFSSIPSSATITSASLSFKVSNANCADASHGTVNLFSASPASLTDLVLDDFDQFGTTAFATEVDASNSGGGTYTFTLNSNGINYLQGKIGNKFALCFRMKKDYTNTTPTGSGYIIVRTSKYSGSEPTLTVNYTTPECGAFLFNFV